jgi:hypothetical protein
MVGRTCCVCNGRTYADAVNNWICRDCWNLYSVEGELPAWALYLRRQAQYEARQGLREHRMEDQYGNPIVTLEG